MTDETMFDESEEHCPTCGCAVAISTASEGTSCYLPLSTAPKCCTEYTEIACAGCERTFQGPEALAEGVCAHCWAAARRIRVHGQASIQAQGDAARFVVENHLPHSLVYPLQGLLEDAAENALHKMIYTCRRGSDYPPLFYKKGRTYHPIAPLDYYPAPGVWLVE